LSSLTDMAELPLSYFRFGIRGPGESSRIAPARGRGYPERAQIELDCVDGAASTNLI
jgi:hypothetical protein